MRLPCVESTKSFCTTNTCSSASSEAFLRAPFSVIDSVKPVVAKHASNNTGASTFFRSIRSLFLSRRMEGTAIQQKLSTFEMPIGNDPNISYLRRLQGSPRASSCEIVAPFSYLYRLQYTILEFPHSAIYVRASSIVIQFLFHEEVLCRRPRISYRAGAG